MTTNATALPTGTWHLDTTATTITVAARKLGLFTVPADLTIASGTIEIDDKHQVANVDIVADSASYTSKNAKRDEHVIGSDFLDADKHPAITFRTRAVAQTADGYQSDGTVTMKGQKSQIEFAINEVDFTDTNGSFTATATIDRKAVGVDKLPAFFVGRNLDLTVKAKAERTA